MMIFKPMSAARVIRSRIDTLTQIVLIQGADLSRRDLDEIRGMLKLAITMGLVTPGQYKSLAHDINRIGRLCK